MRVAEGRVVCTLEGGYDPHGLAVNVDAFLQVLSEFNPEPAVENAKGVAFPVQEQKVAPHTASTVQAVKETFRDHRWWREGISVE